MSPLTHFRGTRRGVCIVLQLPWVKWGRRGYKGESERVQQTYRIKSDTVKSPQAATAVVALQRQSAWTPALRKNLGQI